MNNNCDLSIIIPVFNGANCICACIDSVLKQRDADKFQIIVINDGSTDNTAQIVGEYATKHPNITLVNQKNAGVSASRNRGTDIARGKYVTFIDADDTIGAKYSAYLPYFDKIVHNSQIGNLSICKSSLTQPIKEHFFDDKFFVNLLTCAKRQNVDIALGGKITVNNIEKYIKRHIYTSEHVFNATPADKSVILNQADVRESANFAIYSKSFLDKNNLRFIPGMQLDEDILFCMLACLYAERIVSVPNADYLYHRHENSLSNATNYEISNKRYSLANVQRFSVLLSELAKHPEYATIYNHWLHVFSKECNKVPDSEYAEYFPPTRCAECPYTKCDEKCFLCAGDNYVLQKLRENTVTLFR